MAGISKLASNFFALSAVLCGGGTHSSRVAQQSRQEILRAQASSTSVAGALGGSRSPHSARTAFLQPLCCCEMLLALLVSYSR